MAEHKKHIAFQGKILILGFGAVGQGTLPLLLRHIDMPNDNVCVITAEDWGREIAQEYGVAFRVEPLTRANYVRILDQTLEAGDFLFNASFDVSSLALIEYCSERGILYLDACIEPWAGGHRDTSIPASRRTNYAFREAALAMRTKYPNGPAVVLMHGANPGLVSHFVKQALVNLARDSGRTAAPPATKEAWARLACA
jgi:homospermidine synthase